jgi:hypothetical protein
MIFRALTVRQPYASAMFGPHPKDVENRSRKPPERLIGKRLWIHAGEALEVDALPFVRAMGFDPLGLGDLWDGDVEVLSAAVRTKRWDIVPNPLPHGVILGSVLLDSWTRESSSPWRDPSEECAWILRDPQPLAVPVPVPQGGQLTLGWRLPEDVAMQIVAQERGELRAA